MFNIALLSLLFTSEVIFTVIEGGTIDKIQFHEILSLKWSMQDKTGKIHYVPA